MMSYPVWIVSVWIAIACVAMPNDIYTQANTVTNEETFFVLGCEEGVYVGGIQTLTSVLQKEYIITEVAYDYVNQHIYYTEGANSTINPTYNSASIYRCDLDGENDQMVYNGSERIISITVDAENGYLFFLLKNMTVEDDYNDLVTVTIPDFTEVTRNEVYKTIPKVQAQYGLLWYKSGQNVFKFDLDLDYCEKYAEADSKDADFFTVDDGKIYYGNTEGPSKLQSKDIATGDFEVLLDSNLQSNQQAIAVLGEWIYIVWEDELTVGRFPTAGGSDDDTQRLGNSPVKNGTCRTIHIHKAIPPRLAVSKTVIPSREFIGGFILDLVFNTGGIGIQWTRIDIKFPRPVFDLKVTGCDVIVERKRTTTGGKHNSNTYTLIPSSSSDARPRRDGSVRFTVLGKTYVKRRGFNKQDIIAEIYTNSMAPAVPESC